MIGEVVDSYRIVSVLGQGGMGVVYRAEHVQLGRQVAIKMLQPQLTDDASMVQRFFNEARAASAIDHPGIVEVFNYGIHTDGRAFIVMALLKGETLTAHIEHRAIEPREAAAIVAQVASVLVAAHAAGIVHRDLKPDNIVLVPNELAPNGLQVKLLDFGIAKLVHETAGNKTQTGTVLGTPLYMSPEQCVGGPIDHRTDLYSLGCILYDALTGRPPFESSAGAGAIIAAHLRDEPPDPRTFVASLPEDLVAIVLRLLAKDPAARFQSAREVRDALCGPNNPSQRFSVVSLPRYVPPGAVTTATGAAAQIMSSKPAGPRRTLPIAGALVLAIIAGTAGYVASSRTVSALPRAASAPPATPAVEVPVVDAFIEETAPPPKRAERVKEPRRERMSLGARRYAPSARVDVVFPGMTISTPDARVWLAIAEVGKPSPAPDAWTHVEHGARRVSLVAPSTAGIYEVRLYRNLGLQSTARFVVATAGARDSSTANEE